MNETNSFAPHQPLTGLVAVEIGTSVAAPYAGQILAGLGADLIKVERKGSGDDGRRWGKMFADGTSSLFHALNTNKRSISLDLRDDDDRSWLKAFCVSQADIVIQNMRPGSIDKLGLGAQELTDANQRLIYVNMWAFGRAGPLRDKPGYDPLMQAYGGVMSITGEEGHPPVRVGTSIVDMGTGLWSVIGVVSALHRRDTTGSGCVIDASLYETALAWMANPVTNVQVDGVNPLREGSGARGMAPYQAYECSDGWLVVAAPNDNLFNRLANALGHSEWSGDARFETNQKRYANLSELNALMQPLFLTQTRRQWQTLLDDVGVPSAPVQMTLEMMCDPQTVALNIIQSLPAGGPQVVGLPLSFNGVRPPLKHYAPELGAHSEEIRKGHNR